MPKKVAFKNPTFRGVQAQEGYMTVPDNGEVFLYGGSDTKFTEGGFNSPVNVRSGDQIYSYNPQTAYLNSPEGKLYSAGVKMNQELLGVNGIMGGSQGAVPNFGDPWKVIAEYARSIGAKPTGSSPYSGAVFYSPEVETAGMKVYQKRQDDYYNEQAQWAKKTILDKVNTLDLSTEDKAAFVKSVNDYTPKPGQEGGRFGGYDNLFNQFLASKNVPAGDGRNPGPLQGRQLVDKGYEIIGKQLKDKGINVDISKLAMYNQGDMAYDTSLKKGSAGGIDAKQISDSTSFDDALTTALADIQKTTQATGNQVAKIDGVGPGAKDFREAGYNPATDFNQPADTNRPATTQEIALAQANEAKARQLGIQNGGGATPPVTSMETPVSGAGVSGSTDSGLGFDTTGWTPAQIEQYKAAQQHIGGLNASGQVINPGIEITPELLNRYLTQAQSEVEPYYKQLFSQAQQDLNTSVGRIKEDLGSAERNIGLAYGKNLENTQESYARRGLNMSTQRTGAESTLAQGTNTALEDARQNALRSAQDVGIKGERLLGSANMPSFGNFNSGAMATTGKPGQYGLSNTGQTRQLFNPTGGTTGTYETDKLYDEQTRFNSLKGAEREFRNAFYPNQYNQLT